MPVKSVQNPALVKASLHRFFLKHQKNEHFQKKLKLAVIESSVEKT